MTHLGRPRGVTDSLRLKPVAERLSTLLGRPVDYVSETIGPGAERAAAALENGECLLLENVRFHEGETRNDPDFAAKLAALGDVYVNDAFGTAHRAHASTEGVARLVPVRAAGFLMRKELNYLSGAIENPMGNLVVVLGGAKVSDKIGATRRFIEIADALVIGGGMAYTFLASRGEPVGNSLLEEDRLGFAGGDSGPGRRPGKTNAASRRSCRCRLPRSGSGRATDRPDSRGFDGARYRF